MAMNTDDLMRDILDQYDHQPPGIQAQIEQTAAQLREALTSRGVEMTVPNLREWFAQVIAYGLSKNVGIEQPTRAADSLGMQLAATCLLRRELEQHGK